MVQSPKWVGCLSGGLALAVLAAAPARAETVFKIGNILSLSGFAASVGQHILESEKLWLKLHAHDLPGIKIDLITRDDNSQTDATRRIAQELVVRDHVNILAGITLSPQGFSVAKVATEAKIPVVIMNASTSSITRASPYIVRFAASNWQMAYPLGQYLAQHGYKTAYTNAADYAAGIDLANAFTAGFESKGGKLVGADRTPLSTTDFLPYMQRVLPVKPQLLYEFQIPGSATTAWFRAFHDARLKEAGVTATGIGNTVPDNELQQTGAEAEGMITASAYVGSLTNPQNIAFIKIWKKEFGPDATPAFEAVQAWDGMDGVQQMLKKVGPKASGDQMMAAFKQVKFNGPNGPVEIDPQTRDAIQNIYIGKIEKSGGKWQTKVLATLPMVKDPWKILHPTGMK